MRVSHPTSHIPLQWSTFPIPIERPIAPPPNPSDMFGSIAGRETGMEREKSIAIAVSSSCLRMSFAERRDVTLRASGPLLMYQL